MSSTAVQNVWLEPRQIGDKQLSLIDHLFNRLDGMYPNRWRAAFADQTAISNWRDAWADAFIEDGLTAAEIAIGIKRCRQQFDWPPSLTEFIRACRPSIDPEQAFYEAVVQMAKRKTATDEWSSPLIYWSAVKCMPDLLSSNYQQIKGRWKSAMNEAESGLRSGSLSREIPPALKALPGAGETCSREVAERNLAAIHELINEKFTITKAEFA